MFPGFVAGNDSLILLIFSLKYVLNSEAYSALELCVGRTELFFFIKEFIDAIVKLFRSIALSNLISIMFLLLLESQGCRFFTQPYKFFFVNRKF